MSLLDTIADLGSTYTVTRRGAPTSVKGIMTAAPTTTTLSITASVQPVSGRDQQNLPDAMRTRELRVVFTATEIMPVRPGYVADVVTYGGEPWEVLRSEKWEAFGDTFWRAYIARKAIT